MVLIGILFLLTVTAISIYCIRQPALARKARQMRKLRDQR